MISTLPNASFQTYGKKDVLGDISASLRTSNVEPRTLFQRLDSGGRGLLLWEDFARLAVTYRPDLNFVELDELFWRVNRSCSGEIDFNEFCAALGYQADTSGPDPLVQDVVRRIHNSLADSEADAGELFRRLDTSGCGQLGTAEITRMVCAFEAQLAPAQLDGFLRHFRCTGSGVDLLGFRKALGFPAVSPTSLNMGAGMAAVPNATSAMQQTVMQQAMVLGMQQTMVMQQTAMGMTPGNTMVANGAAMRDDRLWQRVRQVAIQLNSQGSRLYDAFRLFDSNGDGILDRAEFQQLLCTCDRTIGQNECDEIFNQVAALGPLSAQQFAKTFDVGINAPSNSSLGLFARFPTASTMDAALRGLVNRIQSWLDPAVLAMGLGISGETRLSRAAFERMLQTLEPQLAVAECERLFQQALIPGTAELDLQDFIRRFGGDTVVVPPGTQVDSWAMALLRRVARRVWSAQSAPQDLLRNFNALSTFGALSQQDFERLIMTQDANVTRPEMDALWKLVDVDKNSRVDVYEFCSALRYLAMEAQDLVSIPASAPAVGGMRDRYVEARIAQLSRWFGQKGVTLQQGFACYDYSYTGFMDRQTFEWILQQAGLSVCAWEMDEIVAWFATAVPYDGKINYRELVRQFDTSAQARAMADATSRLLNPGKAIDRTAQLLNPGTMPSAGIAVDKTTQLLNPGMAQKQTPWERVADVAQNLQSRGATLHYAFWFFDGDGNGILEPNEFYQLLYARDPNITAQESMEVFTNAAGPQGRLDMQQFATAFGITASSPAVALKEWGFRYDPRLQSVASRINGWLEPALLARSLGVVGQSRLSRADFCAMVLALQPRLTPPDLDRLFQQANATGTPDIDLNDFVRRFTGAMPNAPGMDAWAVALLRSVAIHASAAASSPEDLFRQFDINASGTLSYAEFDRMLRSKDPSITPQDVQELWRVADTDGDGQVDLFEFCIAVRRSQNELEDTTSWANGPPADGRVRGRVVEVRMAQFTKCCYERSSSIEHAFMIYDPMNGGFLHREAFRQLFARVGLNLADWELDEFVLCCDTNRDGSINYKELLRQFDFAAQSKALAAGRAAAGTAFAQGGSAWKRVEQVVKSLQPGYSLYDAFRYFDSDGNMNLDPNEFHRLLCSVDPNINPVESKQVFDTVAGAMGELDLRQFAASFGITGQAIEATQPAAQSVLFAQIDPRMQNVATRVHGWLEPALFAKRLGIAGQSRLSRADFQAMVLALEPSLGQPYLDRLFQQANVTGTPDIDLNDFVKRFGGAAGFPSGPGVDQYAVAMLYRIAQRASAAMSSPEDLFRQFDADGSGSLSQMEFERMVRTKDPKVTQQEVNELWMIADRDRDGKVDIYEFYVAVHQAQLELEDTKSWANGPPADVCTRQRAVEVRMAQFTRCCYDRNLSIEKAFVLYDQAGTGFLDTNLFFQLFSGVGINLAQWELGEFVCRCDTNRDGRINYRELLRQFDFAAQSKALAGGANAVGVQGAPAQGKGGAWDRVAQVVKSLQPGYSLIDAFRFYDSDGDGNLDPNEFHRLLCSCDPNISPQESQQVFATVAGARGQLDARQFASSFNIPQQHLAASQQVQQTQMLPRFDANMQTVTSRINGWLEPALLARKLGLSGRSRLSRADFQAMVLALEPSLGQPYLDRLFQQANMTGTPDMDLNDFVQRFGGAAGFPSGPGVDQYAVAMLYRIAQQASAALSSPEDVFRQFDVDGSGSLSQVEFERMVRTKDPTLTPQQIYDLWMIADRDRDGKVDIYEFYVAVRQSQLELEDTKSWANGPPADVRTRQRAVEVRMAQFTRCCFDRNLSIEQAFVLYDQAGTGFLDANLFFQLFASAGINLAQWELAQFVSRCDTNRDGRINYRELLRQFDFAAQSNALAGRTDAVGVQGAPPQPPQGQGQGGAWDRVAQVVKSLQPGYNLLDAFRFYDSNGDGNLDPNEFHRLLCSCDPNISPQESQQVFAAVAGARGQLDARQFASSFNIPGQHLAVAQPVQQVQVLPRFDARMQTVASRVNGWLEPALLARKLGISGRSRLSRADFQSVVLALEPRLGQPELDRLFQHANMTGTPDIDLNDFVKRYGAGTALPSGPGVDQWAIGLLFRIAQRASVALSAPQDLFRQFDANGSGSLSQMEFERMVRTKDPTIAPQQVNDLWMIADRDGDGKVDLDEFCAAVNQSQLELEDTTAWANGPPVDVRARARVVEVRMAQFNKCCCDRSLSMDQAFLLYDPAGSGFLDQNSFCQLFASVSLNLAQWELVEFVGCCDTNRDGRMNYRELLRQFDYASRYGTTVGKPEMRKTSGEAETQAIQLAQQLRDRNLNLYDVFNFYDIDRDGRLNRVEFQTLLQAINPSMPQQICHQLFELAAVGDQINFNSFANRFNIPADVASARGAVQRSTYLEAPAANVSGTPLQNLVTQIYAWLEPVLLFRSLGLSGQSQLSRSDFERVVQAAEPNLGPSELDRLYREADKSGRGVIVTEFVRRFDRDASTMGASADRWALAALRRIARRVAPIFSAEQTFNKFDSIGRGGLSPSDFERFLRIQEPTVSKQHIDQLFQLADTNRDNSVTLDEFCSILGRLQLEMERNQQRGNTPAPADGANARDRILEVRMVQLARILEDRGLNIENVFSLFDKRRTGHLDRTEFRELMRTANFTLAQWEEEEIFAQCDVGCNGQLNYSELLRRLRSAGTVSLSSSSSASQSSTMAAVPPPLPRSVQPPLPPPSTAPQGISSGAASPPGSGQPPLPPGSRPAAGGRQSPRTSTPQAPGQSSPSGALGPLTGARPGRNFTASTSPSGMPGPTSSKPTGSNYTPSGMSSVPNKPGMSTPPPGPTSNKPTASMQRPPTGNLSSMNFKR